MAVVLDSISATLTRTAFVKPPDLQRELSSMPRAIVNFNVLDGTISIKPVNDTQELIIGMSLDATFAYRMVDFSCSLIQDVANDWNSLAYLEITNAIRNLETGATQRHHIAISDGTRIPTPVEMWVARFASGEPGPPRYVIQAATGSAPVITFKATNNTAAAGVAGTVNFFMSFFEFDIEQAERYPMHWPFLTYPR